MSDAFSFFLVAQLVRCLYVFAGIAMVFMGYRLFLNGFVSNQSAADLSGLGFKAGLKRAAPGTVFALFGAAVLVVSFSSRLFEARFALPDTPTPESPRVWLVTPGNAPDGLMGE